MQWCGLVAGRAARGGGVAARLNDELRTESFLVRKDTSGRAL
jgi:hypothetical protein